jgi:hypothetical protein
MLMDDPRPLGGTRTRGVAGDIHQLAVGDYNVAVTAPSLGVASLDLVIVAGADAVALQPGGPTTISSGDGADLCFSATAAGRYIAGLAWEFSARNAILSEDPLGANCVDASPSVAAGTATIDAYAGGQQGSAWLVIGPAPTARISRSARPARSPAGERATWAAGAGE